MTPDKRKELRELASRATPSPYDARCKEFSNHARVELWTEFGWINELPKAFHEPTIIFQAATDPQAITELLNALDEAEKNLIDARANTLKMEHAAQDAIKRAEEAERKLAIAVEGLEKHKDVWHDKDCGCLVTCEIVCEALEKIGVKSEAR